MDNRRDEQSKRRAEYVKEYQKRPENKERVKERMRLYRARKKKERLDAGGIVSTSVHNNNPTPIQTIYTEIKTPALKTTDIDIDSQNDHQYELHQTPTVSIPQTSNEQITSNNLTYVQESTKRWETLVSITSFFVI